MRPGELLRELREYRRLTQQEMAIRLGCTQAAVSKMESGGDEMQIATVRRYLQVIGFDLKIERSAVVARVRELTP